MTPIYSLRDVRETDWNLIQSDWKKSYRDSHPELAPGARGAANVFFEQLGKRVERMKQAAKWRIACDSDDPNYIFGWCCYEGDVLHYVYVRKGTGGIYRQLGIATKLVEHLPRPLVVTHWTRAAEAIQAEHPGALLYQPSRLQERPQDKAA